MRRILFWLHLGAGVSLSALILFFSVTGALLAFERPLLHTLDARGYAPAPHSPGTPRIPLDQLLAQATPHLPAPLETLTIHPGPDAPVELTTTQNTVYLLDPYCARLQGPISPRARAFFAQVTALHRWFGLAGARHATAITVKSVTVLLLLFSLLSGAILWPPRRWTPTALRAGIVPRIGTSVRARSYSWHKVAGFWTGPPLAVIALTGVVMASPWANALLFRLAGSPVPARQNHTAQSPRTLPTHLDQAFTLAIGSTDHWQSAGLRFPQDPRTFTITVDTGDGGQPQKREQVVIHAAKNQLRLQQRQPFQALDRGRQWRSWVRFLHTGEALGLFGETLAFAATLGAILLSLTGLLLSYTRLRHSRRPPVGRSVHPNPAGKPVTHHTRGENGRG